MSILYGPSVCCGPTTRLTKRTANVPEKELLDSEDEDILYRAAYFDIFFVFDARPE